MLLRCRFGSTLLYQCTMSLSGIWVPGHDHHRNPNSNDRDHLWAINYLFGMLAFTAKVFPDTNICTRIYPSYPWHFTTLQREGLIDLSMLSFISLMQNPLVPHLGCVCSTFLHCAFLCTTHLSPMLDANHDLLRDTSLTYSWHTSSTLWSKYMDSLQLVSDSLNSE